MRRRKELVDGLRRKGIRDEAVLAAIERVERHLFIPDTALHSHAYQDKPFPIGSGQTISQPYTVAYQTELLRVQPGVKVLEIGTGSGYQAAVLAEMGAAVYSIERHKALHERTKTVLKGLGYDSIRTWYGDGYAGKRVYAPYDRIIVTAAAPSVPDALIEQLSPDGGILVIPVDNDRGSQTMRRFTRSARGLEEEIFANFSFVPMLTGEA